jgi:hypothetical protein
MDAKAKESFIREKACQNEHSAMGAKVFWSRHAITEMVADDLDRRQIERALQTCEVIEDYPTLRRPLPDCLVLGWLTSSKPLHAVVAVDIEQDRLFIVTVYLPNNKEWQNDWRTRKR